MGLAADGLGRRKLIESLEEKLFSESCTYAKVSLQVDGCSFYSECYAIASPVSDVEVCSRGAALVYCWGATWQRVQPSQALVLILGVSLVIVTFIINACLLPQE